MKSLISACMIVKNEENFIKKSIQSLLPYVEEIVVVDTGSTDATTSIALELGAHITSILWEDDFSAARNAAIKQASRPIIFMIDADEELNEHTIGALYDTASLLHRDKNLTARVKVRNYTENNSISISYITRMFPNTGMFKYAGRIHEQLYEESSTPRSVESNIELIHHGYLPEVIADKQKVNRNINLLRREASIHEDNPYILYQLGKTYTIQKEYDSAERYLQQAYQLALLQEHYCLPNIIHSLCHTLLHLKRYKEFVSMVDTGIALYMDFTDLYFMKGRAIVDNLDLAQLALVPILFEKCVAMGEVVNTQYETHEGVGTFKALYNLGVYYELIGQKDQASVYYKRSLDYGFKPAMERLHSSG